MPAPMEPITTRVGWADYGDYAHFGRRLYRDFAGRASYLGIASFGLTGRELPPEDVAVLDDVAVCMHCPEPRVWPAKLARVAASTGRFVPGMVVGWTAIDSAIGIRLGRGAAELFTDLHVRAASVGVDAAVRAVLAERQEIPGMGVHVRRVDERVPALESCLARRNRTGAPYWSLAERLWAIAESERQMSASFWSAVAAVFLDLGFEPRHAGPLLGLLFQPSYLAHAFEGAELQSASLRMLPTDRIRYVGKPPRVSPREEAERPRSAR